ncbi:hypothetical protein [Enterococcus faecalis]|uniref:hypothetical protein n=1 Tax=Enterococcus faecalis TaxID=1351 RepID=UPI003D0704C9
MDVEEIIKRIEERVYIEVRKRYTRKDLDQRFQEVLCHRSEKYKRLIYFSKGRKIKKLSDPREFERYMATRGAEIIEEVIRCLNNQPKMQMSEYKRKLIESVREGLNMRRFEELGLPKNFPLKVWLPECENYNRISRRLSKEKDKEGFLYSDCFEYQMEKDTFAILGELCSLLKKTGGNSLKMKIIKLIDAGKTVYATSYESKKEILANFRWENQGMEEKHVEYLFQYDGEDFEYKEIQVLDGDSIYLIHKVEYLVNMNC